MDVSPVAQFKKPLPLSYKVVSCWLSLKHRVRSFLRYLETSRRRDELTELDKVSPDILGSAHQEISEQELNHLKSVLRRHPFWRSGHELVAELSLLLGDAAAAYSSSCASELLAVSESERIRAQSLMARSLLLSGEASRASVIFEALLRGGAQRNDLREDLAACYLALSKHREAFELLSAIGIDQLTPSGREAYLFLKEKVQN